MTKYIVGISDGLAWNAGGQTQIEAQSIAAGRLQAEEWADDGDYPVSPASPPAVQISLWTVGADGRRGENVDRWDHVVPAASCSGDALI